MADTITPNPFYGNALNMYTNKNGLWTATFRIHREIALLHSAPIFTFSKTSPYIGERLKEIIGLLDSQGKTWPWGDGLIEDRDFLVTWEVFGKDQRINIKHVEMTVEAYKLALSILTSPDHTKMKDILRDSLDSELNPRLNVQWEHLPVERGWLVKGWVTKVRDGDTIEMVVDSAAEKLQDWDKKNDPDYATFEPGNTIAIRFLGIDTPETAKDWTDDDEKRNSAIAREYKVKPEIVSAVGDEAKAAIKEITDLGNKYVIVDIDTDKDGNLAKSQFRNNDGSMDTRYVGVVFKSPYNTDWSEDPMTENDWYININKTLIASPSDQIYGQDKYIPLAKVSGGLTYGLENNSRYDYALWEYTVAYGAQDRVSEILEADKARSERLKAEQEAEMARLRSNNGRTVRIVDEFTITGKETLDAIVKQYYSMGYTISKELLISANELIPNEEGVYELPAGMVLLIPRAELATEPGQGVGEQGTIQFEMKHGQSLNNTLDFLPPFDDRRYLSSPYHVRIGDVQFIVPPLGISSNRVSTIERIKTLRTKSSMITKTGSSHETLALQLYFHDLDSINGYEVVQEVHSTGRRSYHMDGLRSLIAQFKKVPFLPIENEYINNTLEIYDVVLVNLNVATVPGFPHSLAATLTLASFDHEAYMPHVADYGEQINYPLMRWYYQQAMDDNRKDNPYRTYLAPIKEKLTNDFHFKIAFEDELIERSEANKELRFLTTPYQFDMEVKEGKNLIGTMKRDAQRVEEALGQYYKWLEVKKKPGYPAYSFEKKSEWYKDIYGEKYAVEDSEGLFVPKELRSYFKTDDDYFYIKIETRSTANNTPEKYKFQEKRHPMDGLIYRFTTSESDIAYLNSIVGKGKDADVAHKGRHLDYEKIREKAESTEASLDMDEVHIDDMLIMQMNITFENNFSMVQMQNAQNPTYQFLGSQDPRIEIMFEATSQFAVGQLQDLLTLSDRYSRQYRYGITSGFLGFENQLTRLFGVDSVMVESCSIHTVPGFVDRFQIELALCGFDKTQKRTESLEGISGAHSTAKEDRHVTKDAASSDAILIERKMKDLELYPDLELPTYKELNDVLHKLDAGFQYYHNPSGAKFVDPDFYVSTNWTFRDFFRQFKDNDGSDEKMGLMELEDFAGAVGRFRVNGPKGQYFEHDKRSVKIAENIDARTKNTQAENFAKVQRQVDLSKTKEVTEDMVDDPTIWSYEISRYQDVEAMRAWIDKIENINTKPDPATVASWGSNLSYEELGINPAPLEFYKELYALVDEFFVKPGYVADERNTTSDIVRKSITYARTGDIADAMYLWLKHSKNSQFKDLSGIKEPQEVKYKDLVKTEGRITRERIANILKSIFHYESDWQQFSERGGKIVPKKDPASNAVGVGQIMLYWHGVNTEYAQRLCWDWRENLRWSVAHFASKFKAALHSDDILVRCRPWDWAVRMYNWESMLEGGDLFNDYFSGVNTIFQGTSNNVNPNERPGAWYNSPANIASAPGQPKNLKIYAYVMNATPEQVEIIEGSIKAMKRILSDPKLRVYNTTGLRVNLLGMGTKVYHTEDELESMTPEEIRTAYEKASRIVDSLEKLDITGATVAHSSEFEIHRHNQDTNDLLKTNLLLNKDTPDKLWRDMFTDMMEYDQRGRMLRAFPTFQMFIIDEGRWMTNYKLWDNLYGFNAIESIDVHKSRKIAADTAVIRMTNMYSNLTSRRLEENYGDWSYNMLDNLFWGNPSQELMDARKELVSGMMLQTGARIHLRMGYGSDATNLPVMFNGTITELDTEDLVTIIAQGDGIELTNIISADPDETNSNMFGNVVEPRDLLCNLLTSKGNWVRNVINNLSDAKFWKEHPLGIEHFGSPVKVPDSLASLGAAFGWYIDKGNDSMGEAVQNIYSSNGMNTFSQWRYQDGTNIDGASWAELFFMNWPDGDEMNVELKYYGQTVWDIAHHLAYVSPDYIAAVHPFEFRSTLFFGKPYYKLAYRYDSVYEWTENKELGISDWKRTVTREFRKPYQQFHVYNSIFDIINNRIKASEEGVYTNVIATGRGKTSMLQQADSDIHFNKQKTKIVETPIVTNTVFNHWTMDKQLDYYAQSELRDSVKDMYKGSLIVLGDPSVKPHDMCHIHDTLHDMNGPFLVKDVTHSFSHQTGFITTISPDAVVVVDDAGTLSQASWFTSAIIDATVFLTGKHLVGRGLRRVLAKGTMLRKGTRWSSDLVGKSMLKLLSNIPHDKNDIDFRKFKKHLEDYTKAANQGTRDAALRMMKETVEKIEPKLYGAATSRTGEAANLARRRLAALSGKAITNLQAGRGALSLIRAGTAYAGLASFGVTTLASLGLTYLFNTIVDAQTRKRKARQALMILPLRYQGRNFTAGLNGAQGAVVGTKPGKLDMFYMGAGYGGEGGWTQNLGRALGWVTGQELLPKDFTDDDMLNLKGSYFLGKSPYGDGLERIDNAYRD